MKKPEKQLKKLGEKRWQGIIKTRAEINGSQSKQYKKKKSKPRNCFRRFNKTDRPMARLIKKEKITEMARIRNE